MKIAEVKKKYPSQWVLAKVLKEGLYVAFFAGAKF